ncbi:MAG: Gfo/Idh/MocA family oxidoreductase [Chloroflexi bacterium]|nr:Gfo/Idh/MocA family oxidoreductase [Chloroflexota bacterium]
MLRVGVVGCGRIGLRHARGYQSHPDARLACVCDVVKERADQRAAELGVRAYYSVNEMLESEPLDAVGVITADGLHFEPTMQALSAGKHVLVEKPLALDLEQARQMVRKADEQGVSLAIDFNRRFAEGYRWAKTWQDEGRLGRLAYVNLRLAQRGPYTSSTLKPYHLLYDLHVHMFDLLRHFAGDVAALTAEMFDPRVTGYHTSVATSLKFASDAVGTLLVSWDSSYKHELEYLELCGDLARVEVHNVTEQAVLLPHESDVRWVRKAGAFQAEAIVFDNTFARRVHAFVTDLVAGRPPSPLGIDGLRSQELIETAIRSFEEGRRQALGGPCQ